MSALRPRHLTPGLAAGPGGPEGETDVRTELRRVERELVAALRDLRFGSVEIVIQDSRVVQIERREKVRLDREGVRLPR